MDNLCERCGDFICSKMSWFNTQMICRVCVDMEEIHPDYHLARAANRAAEDCGNSNFAGIGWPGPDKRIVNWD